MLVERVADAVLGEAEGLHAGLPGALHRGLEGVVHGDVDPLEHRGQDAAGVEIVLVAVDADRELPEIGGGLQHAEAGAAGGGG